MADLKKAVNLDSSFAEAWHHLVSLYDQAGRHAEARQAQRRFEAFKENKTYRETEILRNVFLKVLSGEGSPQDNRFARLVLLGLGNLGRARPRVAADSPNTVPRPLFPGL